MVRRNPPALGEPVIGANPRRGDAAAANMRGGRGERWPRGPCDAGGLGAPPWPLLLRSGWCWAGRCRELPPASHRVTPGPAAVSSSSSSPRTAVRSNGATVLPVAAAAPPTIANVLPHTAASMVSTSRVGVLPPAADGSGFPVPRRCDCLARAADSSSSFKMACKAACNCTRRRLLVRCHASSTIR